MIENKEFQQLLAKYPDDITVGIAIRFNDLTSIFSDIQVKGISCHGRKAVIIMSEDVNNEYETLINGEVNNDEIHRE